MGLLVTRSEFEEQRRNRKLTLLFTLLGVVWMAGLGFWAVFSHLSLFATLSVMASDQVPSWLTDRGTLLWCLQGSLFGVSLWLLLSAGLYYRSNAALPKLLGATPASVASGQRLGRLLKRVLAAAGVAEPGPKLFVWAGPGRNAFAAGRDPNHGAIVVTEPLLAALTDDELEAVLGHELAHLKHRDSEVMVQAVAFAALVVCLGYAAAGLVGLVVLVCIAGLAAIFALISESADEEGGWIIILLALGAAVWLVLLGLTIALVIVAILGSVILLVGLGIKVTASALAQSREYLADARSAGWTGRPELMASALRKVAALDEQPPSLRSALLQPLMLQERRSRFSAKRAASWVNLVLRTHPRAESRISALEAMAGGALLSTPRGPAKAVRLPMTGRWGWILAVAATTLFAAVTIRVGPTAGAELHAALEAQLAPRARGPAALRPIDTAFVNQDSVRLRSAPDLGASVVDHLRRCTDVDVFETRAADGKETEWSRVRVKSPPNQEGWIATRLLRSRKGYFPGLRNPLDNRSPPPC